MIDAARARRVRLVGFDVDGTLTDGGIYLGAIGANASNATAGGELPVAMEFKKYDIQDGLGIHLLRSVGIKVAIVTGRESESVRLRALELNADDIAQDALARKYPLWRAVLARQSVSEADAAFVGDDLPDLGIMRRVGLAVGVANAVPEVRAVAHVMLSRAGGSGAVREFAELLLKARGEWDDAVRRYVAEREGPMELPAAERA